MSPFAVEVHPLAAGEAEAAERWYRERNETAAARFRRELDRAVELIAERPEAAPPYVTNTRRFLLRRFPFFVVYRVYSGHVQVVAVAHARRRPHYWRDR
jgi:plasmid stabilization system protein ParE